MGLIAAKACGYDQFIFPPQACIYHIDHSSGWESMTALDKVKFINEKPGIGWDIVTETALQLLEEKKAYNFNKLNWGFADVDLETLTYNSFE
jgi:hypothetical protein